MRLYIILLSSFFVISGCSSTPDLGKWAEGSAAISSAVAANNSDTLSKIDTALEKIETGQKEDWALIKPDNLKEWKGYRNTYYEGAAIVNAGMAAMVKYANAVAELAAAGETGREASQSLINSAELIFETAGSAFPGGLAAGKAVGAVLGEVADIVTKVQAQDALSDTMGEMKPAVKGLVERIKVYTEAQIKVIDQVSSFMERMTIAEYGFDRVGWSKRNKTYKRIEQLFRSGDAEKTLATLELLDREMNHVRSFDKRIFEIRKWREENKIKLKEILAAANEWAKAHDDAANLLAKCGGMKSLNFKCGNYTAANLLQAKTRIENVIIALEGI